MATGPHVGVHVSGDSTTVTFPVKALDERNLKTLGNELASLVEALTSPTLCLDLAGVEYMGTRWLGRLVALHKQLHRRGKTLTVRNAQPFVYGLFTLTRLATLLDVSRGETPAEGQLAPN